MILNEGGSGTRSSILADEANSHGFISGIVRLLWCANKFRSPAALVHKLFVNPLDFLIHTILQHEIRAEEKSYEPYPWNLSVLPRQRGLSDS